MLEQLTQIFKFILDNFLNIWPYLLVTIPLAVAVNMSGASRYIRKAFDARPVQAIFLATLVGAFSPFCSCSVIPMIAGLLIGGVPLAPVMSFWIASPSMDPEAFFLSVSMLGWDLAVWRMGATLLLSLGAGFVTHFIVLRGWFGENYLQARKAPKVRTWGQILTGWGRSLRGAITPQRRATAGELRLAEACCQAAPAPAFTPRFTPEAEYALPLAAPPDVIIAGIPDDSGEAGCASGACSLPANTHSEPEASQERQDFWARLWRESLDATGMVIKFMALAFALEALIHFYVPETWITALLGGNSLWTVPLAALLGVPVYTSNLTALPLIGGLVDQGMNPGAALAFLVAGPTTTLPAMAAVWGLVSRRVFAVYVAAALFGAVISGFVYSLFA